LALIASEFSTDEIEPMTMDGTAVTMGAAWLPSLLAMNNAALESLVWTLFRWVAVEAG
jgi:hypothetical protein